MRSTSFLILLALFGGLLTVGTNTAHADTRVHYLYNDSRGTPVAAANDQGQVLWRKHYRPFGAEAELAGDTIETVADDRGFTGHTYDRESGLVYMGARYYNPQLGIFYGTDPAPVAAAVPLTFNRYIYANQNPYAFIDPDGRNPLVVIGIIVESSADAVEMQLSWMACVDGVWFECVAATASAIDLATGPNPLGETAQAISWAAGTKQRTLTRLNRRLSSSSQCFVTGTAVQTTDGAVAIQDIRVGDRVETSLAGHTASSDVQWVQIDAVLTAEDHSLIHISQLTSERTHSNLKAVSPGDGIHIVLPELGIDGIARIERIEHEVNSSKATGRLVVATVSRLSNDVYELSFVEGGAALRGTSSHPLYSLDRDDWVRVRDLQVGERLQTAEGAVTIEALEKVRGVHRVYNLEVEGDHEYLVGEAGVRAHNNKVNPGRKKMSGVPGDDFVPKDGVGPYKRPGGAGPTAAQKRSVQGKPCVDCGTITPKQVADHKDPLVVEHYRTGSNDLSRQTSVDAVQPHCPTCSARQGGQLGAFGRKMRKQQ